MAFRPVQQVHIMVVEDEKIVAADIRHNLTTLGYSVPPVLGSGEEAIKKAAEQCPDLVLMDIQLNGKIDGIEAAKIVQNRLNVPVVFITAFADEATIQRAKSTEPYGYIVKPFGKKELQSTIEIALYKYGRERRLKINEQWLMSVFRSIGDPVIAVDRAGSICIMNQAAETITGCELDASLGAHWRDLWRFADPAVCGGAPDPISAAIERPGIFHLVDCPVQFTHTGSKMVMGSIASIRDSGGRVSGAAIVFRDTTAQQLSETEFERGRSLESLQRLASEVAHTMNNVVTIIAGYTQSLVHSIDEADHRIRDARMIEQANTRALALTRQLLDFSRSQPGRPEFIPLNRDLRNIEEMLKHSVGPDVNVRFELADESPSILADASQFAQILMILAAAAGDRMARKGTLTIRSSCVQLDSALVSKFNLIPPGPYACVQVEDSGPGIPYENQGQIFGPFFAADGLETSAGVGRSSLYVLVKQSGGHLWCESDPERGTVFSLYFPLARPPVAAKTVRKAPVLPRGTETILIVDDESAGRQCGVEALKLLGYTVLEAGSGQEALRICERHSGPIDLVLADVMLPNITATDLAARVQNLRPAAKILFASSYSRVALEHHGVIGEGTPLLRKPFIAETLAQRLRETLTAAS